MYYSRSGKTEKIAKNIQNALHCDAIKVEPEKAYGNYISSISRVIKEKSKSITPAIKTRIPFLDPYNVIIIGYPVWAHDIPSFFANFVQGCNLRGKTVVPFATSSMTAIEYTMKTLKRVCPESNIILPFSHSHLKKTNFDKWIQAICTTAAM
jgi:flavodoxin